MTFKYDPCWKCNRFLQRSNSRKFCPYCGAKKDEAYKKVRGKFDEQSEMIQARCGFTPVKPTDIIKLEKGNKYVLERVDEFSDNEDIASWDEFGYTLLSFPQEKEETTPPDPPKEEKERCEACDQLCELFGVLVETKKATERHYWLFTELFVKLHDGRDYCQEIKIYKDIDFEKLYTNDAEKAVLKYFQWKSENPL